VSGRNCHEPVLACLAQHGLAADTPLRCENGSSPLLWRRVKRFHIMGAEETELEMVRRHVRQGADHVAHQRALLARLIADGLPTEEAAALLANFEDLQEQHEAHLARVEDKGSRAPGDA
jgi:hypothetical protein